MSAQPGCPRGHHRDATNCNATCYCECAFCVKHRRDSYKPDLWEEIDLLVAEFRKLPSAEKVAGYFKLQDWDLFIIDRLFAACGTDWFHRRIEEGFYATMTPEERRMIEAEKERRFHEEERRLGRE
jgi:hypothetical protein